jgi:hypothetical protein
MESADFKNKLTIIKEANNKIIKSETHKNIIFVYTPPKVGSTSLVSSIRLSAADKFVVIHLHDEVMLNYITGINDITINEIVWYNNYIGKNVYVIDVYRTPIERKFSEFFEKISPYHFNNYEEKINNYNINRVITRFNKVFPYLALGDHYIDRFDIGTKKPFDFENNYLHQKINNINYIKLRLKDSDKWGQILTKLLDTEITMINDYQTNNKTIGVLYQKFKNEYKIPINYFETIKNDYYLSFYYSETERNDYLNSWNSKISNEIVESYSQDEYTFYVNLYLENQHLDDLQFEHYIDNGCLCNLCSGQRIHLLSIAKSGNKINTKIIHHNNLVTHTNNMNKIKSYKSKNKKNPNAIISGNKIKQNLMTSLISGIR